MAVEIIFIRISTTDLFKLSPGPTRCDPGQSSTDRDPKSRQQQPHAPGTGPENNSATIVRIAHRG